MEFISKEIDAYAAAFTGEEPELLSALNRETWTRILYPRMLSGHMQGRILSMFSKMLQPSRILEIGTYTGYSAICLAEGLASGGTLDTIDINEELAPMISRYINASAFADSITLHTGNALDIISVLPGTFDLVFIDADKENYSRYFDMVIDRVPSGGMIIADNVLWSGKVLEHSGEHDRETESIRTFNRKVHADQRVENLLLPVRDGLMLLRKI
jgi:caffeoyl-CoA O-methyltransferase